MACLTCPIGAANAGKPFMVSAQAIEDIRMICPRCERPAQRLINGLHCVSCYNREAECRRGRDRKGNRPGLLDKLRTSTIIVFRRGEERVVQHPNVTGAAEAMLVTAKISTGRIGFGYKPPVIQFGYRPPPARWVSSPQLAVPLDLPVILPPPLPAWMTA